MADYRPNISNTQTAPPSCPYPTNPTPCPYPTDSSSCPYPTTPGDFPMPVSDSHGSTYDNIATPPIGMLSPYHRDRIMLPDEVPPVIATRNGATSVHLPPESIPSAPYVNENSGNQWSNNQASIGFSNPMAEVQSNPSDPPPSYNDLFTAPNNVVQPNIVSNGNSSSQPNPVVPPRTIVVPRSVNTTGNRVITHAPVQLIGVRSSRTNNNSCKTWIMFAVIVGTAFIFIILYRHSRSRY